MRDSSSFIDADPDARRVAAYEFLVETKLIAIVRVKGQENLPEIAAALRRGGIAAIEFTLNSPGALEALRACAQRFGDDTLLGAGTVLSPRDAVAAAEAGARFLVSPVLDPDVIEAAHANGCAMLPGAFTPTEIAQADALGADLVKLFPAGRLGPEYVREVLAPLDHVRLVPTGGVRVENVAAYLDAGAAALAIGSSLARPDWVVGRNYEAMEAAARSFREAVNAWNPGDAA